MDDVGNKNPKLIWIGGHVEQPTPCYNIVENSNYKILTIDSSASVSNTKYDFDNRPLIYRTLTLNNENKINVINTSLKYKKEITTKNTIEEKFDNFTIL